MSAQANRGNLSRGERSSPFLRVVAGVLLVGIIAAAIAPDAVGDLGPLLLVLGYGASASTFIRYGLRSEEPDARAFLLMGCGALMAAVGVVVFGIVALFSDLPPFSAWDVLFFATYAFYLAGIISMPAVARHWRSRVRIVIDSLVAAVSVSAVMWIAVLQPIAVELAELPVSQRLIGGAYPVLDAAMITGVMVLFLRRSSHRFDLRLLPLSIGFASQAIADMSYLTRAAGASFEQVQLPLVALFGASLASVVAAVLVRSRPAPKEVTDRSIPLWSYVLPYTSGVVVVGYHLFLSLTDQPESVLLEVAAVLVMGLVIARQSLAIHENRTKVEAERRSLIASVSHELRTPLTSMIGFLTVMQEAGDELPPEEREELSEVVLEQANYMGRMVTDIVMLARDTPEKMTLKESAIPIRSLLTSILDTLGQDAGRVETRIDPDFEVSIDVDRVRQMTVNLLQNALRYGADRCELHLYADLDVLVIEVHDNGPGVPRRHQQAIWERFERGSNQLNSLVPGTGLGLAIVDMIAKAHGGAASYRDSELLGGACFSVTLPERVVREPETAPAAITIASQPASARSL